ncbi:hypothetical protein ACTU6U_06065 [Microbacterium sp. A196]|uniref:hypothetical protein n=1 Tax=Microbacterium sp. A196 TaxID=3457320 RepID=UPI003FD625B2
MTTERMTTAALITRAEDAAVRHSTPSHLADALRAAVVLLRRDEAAEVAALETALTDLAAFRHIVTERGEVVSLSMYVRGLLDSAHYAEENPATTPAQLADITAAVALIDAGDEAGVVALEAALARSEIR